MERQYPLGNMGTLGNDKEFCVLEPLCETGMAGYGTARWVASPRACDNGVHRLPSQPGESYGPSLRKKCPKDTGHHFRDQGKACGLRGPPDHFLTCVLWSQLGLHTRQWP